jgi:hypothetical protein
MTQLLAHILFCKEKCPASSRAIVGLDGLRKMLKSDGEAEEKSESAFPEIRMTVKKNIEKKFNISIIKVAEAGFPVQ